MTPIDIAISIATNFFAGCTQQLLGQIDQRTAAARVDSDSWKERSKTLEQRITQQLNLAARSINYPAENLDRLAAILSDQVFVSDTVTAFLDGRLQPAKFAEEIASRDPNLKNEVATHSIAQALLDVFTTSIAADAELSRIVDLKRSEGTKQQLADIDAKVTESRALLTELVERTVLAGVPGEQLTPQQRYERALADVAAAHSITVSQLRKAIDTFIAYIKRNSAASDFDRALALFAEQKYASAEIIAKQAVEHANKAAERALHRKREALVLLGDIQRAQLKYGEAEANYRRAYEIAEAQDPIFLFEAGWRLSRALGELGKYDEAVVVSKRLLELGEKDFDANGVMVALNYLGLALQQAGKYAEAEPVLRRALALWESKSQTEDLMLATHLHNLSTLLRDQGKRSEAEPISRRALAIREKFLGNNHPDVATCLTQVALLLDDDGKQKQAEELFRRALATYEEFLPIDHPYCITARSNLGMSLKARNRLDEAEALLRAAVEGNERAFGREHPHFAESLNNLGDLLMAQHRPDEAAKIFQRALEIQKKIYGPEHPHTQISQNNFGLCLFFSGNHTAAEKIFRNVLEIKQRVVPNDHASLANTLNNLGFVLYSQNRLEEAESFYRRALALRENCLHESHPELGNSLGNMGLVLSATQRHAEAELMFARELKIRQSANPPNPEVVAEAMNNLAVSQYRQGKSEQARKTLGEMIQYSERELGPEHALTADARRGFQTVTAHRES